MTTSDTYADRLNHAYHLHTLGGKQSRSAILSDGRKALAPCITLGNKGDKGLPFMCIR